MKNIIKQKNCNQNGAYLLKNKCPEISFSKQEAELLIRALQGDNIAKIASSLRLTPRTVEFYFSKMRLKLNCNSKADLIEKVMDSDFLKNKSPGVS